MPEDTSPNNNATNQENRSIRINNTPQTTIQGNVDTGGGDFVGRDIVTFVVQNPDDGLAVQQRRNQQNALIDGTFDRLHFEPETVLIPAGAFEMGDDVLPEASPRHTVHLPLFRISKYQVTNHQFAEFIRLTNRVARPQMAWDGQTPSANQLGDPVTGVTFDDARDFCQWLSSQSRRGYGLPHEAAWERAASAGEIVWGTVSEWTRSLWGEKRHMPDQPYLYPWQDDGRNDAEVGAHLRRVVRGGVSANLCARSSAAPDQPGVPGKRLGFRIMLSIDQGEHL